MSVKLVDLVELTALTTLSCDCLYTPLVGSGTSLPHLQIIDCFALASYEVDVVDSVSVVFPGLVSLRIRNGHDFSGGDASGAGHWPQGQTLPNLVSLDVLNISLRPRNMANNCVAVEQLVCRDMSARPANEVSNTDAGLSLQVLGQHLRSLTVTNVTTDELLASVVLACPLLTDLCIDYTSADIAPQVTDVGMVATASACGLRQVSLKRCSVVTFAGVASLAVQPVMESISVEGCPLLQWRDVQRAMKMVGRLGVDYRVT